MVGDNAQCSHCGIPRSKASRQVTDFIVPDCWKAPFVACHGMVHSEGGTTGTQLGQAGWLPPISQAEGISESPFVEVKTMTGNGRLRGKKRLPSQWHRQGVISARVTTGL